MRNIFIIILVFFCTALAAQKTPNMMCIRLVKGDVTSIPTATIDSITISDSALLIHLKSGNKQWCPIATIASITFAEGDVSEYHEAVDMGLSVCWATCNVGASHPEDFGGRFAWGETVEKRSYTEENYTFFKNEEYEYIGVNICGTKYDVARRRWGGEWRLPTRSELAELTTRCTWTPETLNGVNGYRVTAQNGNSIFLPSAGLQNGAVPTEVGTGGYYWSGIVNRSMLSAAYNLNFRGYDAEWTASRAYGFSIRAVR